MRPNQGRGMPSKSRSSKRPAPRARAPPPARRPAAKKPASSGTHRPVRKTAPARPAPKASGKPTSKAPAKTASAPTPAPPLEVPLPGGRRHVLSLSFVRDGDEFMARLETDSGHITELKNRALDQLLTLVAGELEDLLE